MTEQDEIIMAHVNGKIGRETMKQMLRESAMNGKPPVVKPDKFVIPYKNELAVKVTLLVEGKQVEHYLLNATGTSTDDFVVFERSVILEMMVVERETYFFEDSEIKPRGPVVFNKKNVLSFSTVSVRMAEKEDVEDGWRSARARNPPYGY